MDNNAQRLSQQGLLSAQWTSATDCVHAFGAVQAQDYFGAKWAVGQRTGLNDAAVEEAFNAGQLIRTHLLRPTWHFVVPQDIRWMLQLSGPRVRKFNGFMYRKLELDAATFRKANKVFGNELKDVRHVDRHQLSAALKRARIDVSDMRFVHLLMDAELIGLLCSGPRVGKQFTYALLEERVPAVKPISDDEALAELLRRYFNTRGPATLRDFCWWSGLTIADAKRGMAFIAGEFEHDATTDLWMAAASTVPKIPANTVHLLPNYDEYGIGLKDRSSMYDPAEAQKAQREGIPVHRHMLVVNGRVVGTWDSKVGKKEVRVKVAPFKALTKAVQAALVKEKERYAAFLGLMLSE